MKLGGLILFTLGVLPGQAPDGRPAASTVRGKEYPRIHSDRRVTFRVQAPSAKQVAVAGRAADSGMNGNTPYEMKRGEGGVWQVTTGPVRPGFHYYELIIDGIHTIDPSSETYFGWAQSTASRFPTNRSTSIPSRTSLTAKCGFTGTIPKRRLTWAGIKHIWMDGAGSHEWQVWRKHLYDFAPRLFQPKR